MRTTEIKQHEEKKQDKVTKVTEIIMTPSDETFDAEEKEVDYDAIKEEKSTSKAE